MHKIILTVNNKKNLRKDKNVIPYLEKRVPIVI